MTTTTPSATMIAQLAAAVVLVVGAGLLSRSLLALQNVDPGFVVDDRVTARVHLAPGLPGDLSARASLLDELAIALERDPALAGVALAGGALAQEPEERDASPDFKRIGAEPVENEPVLDLSLPQPEQKPETPEQRAERLRRERQAVIDGHLAAAQEAMLAGRVDQPLLELLLPFARVGRAVRVERFLEGAPRGQPGELVLVGEAV